MSTPLVDVIIPVHRTDRSVDLAIDSARSAVQGVATRVLVVLHNLELDAATFERLSAKALVIHCDDDIGSPSGPRNAGLAVATAEFVFFLDSDDALAPSCLRHLCLVARRSGADIVLPSILGSGGFLGTPLVFSRDERCLDVVRDGVFYRSHCFALLNRDLVATSGIRFPDGVQTGQDLVFMAKLYVCAQTSIAFDAVYRLIDHDGERVTTTQRSPTQQLEAVRMILESEWLSRLPPSQRKALVHRIVAVNLASGWRQKRRLGLDPSARQHAALRELAWSHAPDERRLLSVRDRTTLRFSPAPGLLDRFLLGTPFGILPTSLLGLVSRQGPVRVQARSWLVRHRPRRRNERLGGNGAVLEDAGQ